MGALKRQTPPSNEDSFVFVARASASGAPDALSSSLSEDEQAALDAFLASGGDFAKAKALMVEAAATKVNI